MAPGCGVEALFGEAFDKKHELPTTVISGTVSVADAEIQVLQTDGTAVEWLDASNAGNAFEIALPSAEYQNLRLVATKGEKQVRALVPRLAARSTTGDLTVDAVTTTELIIIEAKMSAEAKTLATVSPEVLAGVSRVMETSFGEPGTAQDFQSWVAKIIDAADEAGTTLPFQTPVLDTSYATVTSGLSQAWLDAANLDYDGNGQTNTGTTATDAFDAALEELAQTYDFAECLDPDKIRVVFEVDFNSGLKDGNCFAINRFKWASDEPGKSMFIVGGIHKDSPVQDPELDKAMSNTGGWVPNKIPMYDDGTNGDAVAADNIWTIYFDMPRGARVGYKFTWGKPGLLWTGTEEWPGNQRILEAVDVNGDNIVFRRDNFQDEATNKDLSNLYIRGSGRIDWETDANMDGVPDARERMIDVDNDCVLDEWMTPAGVGPATVDCAEIGGQ
ncbi:MAG: hypothetical protein H6730_19215 [Deltaproteobacteria bacterium]|nr:hypothetical protein [Deltaproteobacteria bacterium]